MEIAAFEKAVLRQPIRYIANELNSSRFWDKCCSYRERNYN